MRTSRQSKRILVLAILLSAFTPPACLAQRYRSLVTSPNPRFESLAGAAVAIPGTSDGFTSNPAGLATTRGAWIDYMHRGDDSPTLAGGGYSSCDIGLSTRFGTFAATYRRYTQGESPPTSYQPNAPKQSDYTLGLAWGYALTDHFQLGLAAKTVRQISWSDQYDRVSTQPFLVDLGILLNTGRRESHGGYRNNASLGFSFQNIGSDYRISSSSVLPRGFASEIVVPLPFRMHLGISCMISPGAHDSESVSPVRILLVAEAMSPVNDVAIDDSYQGLGAEISIMEILDLRLGYYAPANGSGSGRMLALRYGAAIRIPLDLPLGPSFRQLYVKGAYAAIPLGPSQMIVGWGPATYSAAIWGSYLGPDISERVHIFTLGIEYDGDLFP